MNSSVDRLFENEGEVFLSNSYAEFQQLPCIQEQASTPKVHLCFVVLVVLVNFTVKGF